MEYVYKTQGTCSTNIELNVEDGVVKEVAFWGGCNGNLQGISRLVRGMKVADVIAIELKSVVWQDGLFNCCFGKPYLVINYPYFINLKLLYLKKRQFLENIKILLSTHN